MSSKRVLVTGGAGYIGSHTVLALGESGGEVSVVDDLSTGSADLVPKGVPLHVGNIGDIGFVKSVIAQEKPTAIIHFAASLSVPESVVNPLQYYRNNFANTSTLVEAAVAASV